MQVNDPLTDSNFSDWLQEMTTFLFAKNKMGFVDGSIPKPDKTTSDYMAWMRCDAMIRGWLTTAMEKEICNSVKYANTAEEIWKDLKERFGKESATRAYELKQSLTLTRQDGTSISAYYTKLRGLWDEIETVLPAPRCTCKECSCEVSKRMNDFKEKERVFEFLMGLDIEFNTVRTHLLTMKPSPSLGDAYRLAAEDEQQRQILTMKKAPTDVVAFAAGPPRKQYKDKTTHKSNEQCTWYEKVGHNRDGCFERIGYPEWWPGKTKRERSKPKAACVDNQAINVGGLSEEQYQTLLKHFTNGKDHQW